MSEFTTLRIEMHGHVALVTMDNPPVNALSRALNDEITRALDECSENADVRAVVLTGAGKVFCAGADLKARKGLTDGPGALTAHLRRTRECFHSIRECAKPVVIAVNGAALGAGLAIVASGDVLIASENASLGMPEIDVGLMGGCRHAMRLFSHSLLRRMAFTGMRVNAEELYRRGIIEQCTTRDALVPAALEIATTMASKSPGAASLLKHTMNTIEDMSLRDGYRYEQGMTASISKTDDAKEALAAFLEKRAPNFTGR
ncbi:MAG: enoyl-CoA hydratase/isomerase family protein [Burkholderiales bacterium]